MKSIVSIAVTSACLSACAHTAVTNENGTVTLTASDGQGLCYANENGPSTMTSVVLPRAGLESIWKDCEYGDPSAVVRYSTLSIKRELAALNKWAAAKALMEQSGVWDDYILANYLAANDPVFVSAKAGFVQAGIVTQAELDVLLAKCIWTAD